MQTKTPLSTVHLLCAGALRAPSPWSHLETYLPPPYFTDKATKAQKDQVACSVEELSGDSKAAGAHSVIHAVVSHCASPMPSFHGGGNRVAAMQPRAGKSTAEPGRGQQRPDLYAPVLPGMLSGPLSSHAHRLPLLLFAFMALIACRVCSTLVCLNASVATCVS